MNLIVFLSVDDVLQIHENTIANEGGMSGVRDTNLLESAVMMPQQQFGGNYLHEDIFAMAAAYLFHIAKNHAFFDGNKRTAALTMLIFLKTNGVEILPNPSELEQITLNVASGNLSKDRLIEWLRNVTN